MLPHGTYHRTHVADISQAYPSKPWQYKATRQHTPQNTRAHEITGTPTLCHPHGAKMLFAQGHVGGTNPCDCRCHEWLNSPGGGSHTPLCPCSHTSLSKHGDHVFPHFWVYFGTIGFAVPIQSRLWFVALCGPQEGPTKHRGFQKHTIQHSCKSIPPHPLQSPPPDACLSYQKVQGPQANRRRHRLTEPTTKALSL